MSFNRFLSPLNLIAVGLLLTLHTLSAAELTCPASLSVTPNVQEPGKGWKVFNGAESVPLDQVVMFLDNPSHKGSLVPDDSQKTKTEARDRWTFHRASGDTYWLGCAYLNTTAVAARELEQNISQCEVRYSLLPTGRRLAVKDITCK